MHFFFVFVFFLAADTQNVDVAHVSSPIGWVTEINQVSSLSKLTVISWNQWLLGIQGIKLQTWSMVQKMDSKKLNMWITQFLKSNTVCIIKDLKRHINNYRRHAALIVTWLRNLQRITGQSSPKQRSLWGSRNVDHVLPNWVKMSADRVITLEQSSAQSRAWQQLYAWLVPVTVCKNILFHFLLSLLPFPPSPHLCPRA